MNLPNKLTVARIIMVPLFVLAMLLSKDSAGMKIVAFVIFGLASLTDLLDGWIARSRNLITSFGKFADPIADKLLISSALICFVKLGSLPAWIAIIVIARELIIDGIRLVAAEKGVVIASSVWGKLKTDCQVVTCILLIFNQPHIKWLNTIFIVLMLVLTIVSLVDYIIKNRFIFIDGAAEDDVFDTDN